VVFGVVWYGFTRHHGQLFCAFVAFAWLAGGFAAGRTRTDRLASRLLTALLGVQLFAGAVMLAADVVRPFSNASAVARYLRTETDPEAILVGSRDYAVQPVTAWIDGEVFYPESGRFGTFLHWGPERRLTSSGDALRAAESLQRRESRPVVLMLTSGPGDLEPGQERVLASGARLRHLVAFEGAMVTSENYWLYLLH
jgi:hypothetical protein